MPAAVRRASAVVPLVLLALIAVLLPARTASAADEPVGARIGFSNGGGFAWQSDESLARELDLMAATGAAWVRLDFDWSGVEGTRGRYSWSNLDRLVDAIQARGMKVLALPAYTPAWARPAGTTTHHPPTDPAHFAAFVGAAAARYAPKGVTVWEIWNEPNIPNFWEPKPDVAGYVTLLRAASAAIRAAAPGATIVTGGLSPASDSSDGRYVDPRTFVTRMYELGARSSFDAVGVHPYSFPALPSDVRTASWNTFQKMTTIRDTMVANGDAAKKIWLTETGAPTGASAQAVTEQRQAEIISDTIRATEGLSWAGPVFLYAARDAGSDLADREDNFGLLRRDFSPKLAWTALTSALRPSAPVVAPAAVSSPSPAPLASPAASVSPPPSPSPSASTAPAGSLVQTDPVPSTTVGSLDTSVTPVTSTTPVADGWAMGPSTEAAPVPTGVSIRPAATSVTVRWAQAWEPLGYVVERTTAAPGTAGRSWTRVALNGPDVTWYTDRAFTAGQRYYYRVKSYTATLSGPSAEVSAVVGAVFTRRTPYAGPAGRAYGARVGLRLSDVQRTAVR